MGFLFLGTFLIVLIQYFIWKNIELNVSVVSSLNVILYAVIAPLLVKMLPGYNTVDFLATKITEGEITNLLLKPIPLPLIVLANELGNVTFKIFFLVFPTLIAVFLFLEIDFHTLSYENILLFLFSFSLSYILSFLITLLIGLLSIWIGNIWGVTEIYEALLMIMGGTLIPLSLYPNWLYSITEILPFQYIIYTPISYLTSMNTLDFTPLIIQFIWISIFLIVVIIFNIIIKKRAVFFGG